MGKNKHTYYDITKVLFGFWILVILWQTLRPVANRSMVDSLVKVVLFGNVLYYGITHRDRQYSGKFMTLFFLFLITQVITIVVASITVGGIITSIFMMVQIIVFLILLQSEEISIEALEWFAKSVILVACIMGGYSVFFETSRFIRAYTSVGAYGSECNSFLFSNHEYALYLSTAIVFTVWLQFNKQFGWTKFAVLIIFLVMNLISTFSRTATLGCIISIGLLALVAGKEYFSRYVLVGFGALCVALVSGKIRNFIFGKMLKDSVQKSGSIVDAGRSEMYQSEWLYFKQGSILENLFGHGYDGNYGGGHDAYLMILNTGGIIMFLFFLVTIIFCIKKSLLCRKLDKMTGSLFIGLQVLVLLYMVAQTPILFYSTMDSFFITCLFVMLPLYTTNYLIKQKTS